MELVDGAGHALAVVHFTDDLVLGFEDGAQPQAHERVIIHDENTDFGHVPVLAANGRESPDTMFSIEHEDARGKGTRHGGRSRYRTDTAGSRAAGTLRGLPSILS